MHSALQPRRTLSPRYYMMDTSTSDDRVFAHHAMFYAFSRASTNSLHSVITYPWNILSTPEVVEIVGQMTSILCHGWSYCIWPRKRLASSRMSIHVHMGRSTSRNSEHTILPEKPIVCPDASISNPGAVVL
jgi:hypothetical protein